VQSSEILIVLLTTMGTNSPTCPAVRSSRFKRVIVIGLRTLVTLHLSSGAVPTRSMVSAALVSAAPVALTRGAGRIAAAAAASPIAIRGVMASFVIEVSIRVERYSRPSGRLVGAAKPNFKPAFIG